ncbi:alpha/beta fold hydrolase [Burkholderia gladioli]|uniref:alpha/beta fold hydrolase n=1 Tax=Burkholderia gladioli TaxID=28095 RepID=UPI001641252A|nr:alpha/beta hydrolase [Burkholderia gladioli]
MSYSVALYIVGGAVLAFVAVTANVWKSDVPVESLKTRYADSSSQFIELDGMMVHVRDEGNKDDPTPIVLLHGTGSSLQAWDGWTSQLKAKRRVIRLDRPGFGLTGPNPSGDYSMEYYVGFLARLLDQLRIRNPAIIVGNSSGGYMAWRFAVAYPDRVSKLVLIDPAGYPRSTPLPSNLAMAMNPRMDIITQHILPISSVRKGLEASYGDPSRITTTDVQRYYDITRRKGNRAALGATLRQSTGHENPDLINQVKASTLVMWGTKDTVIPASPDAEEFHHRIAGSTLVMLPGVGHLGQEEDPIGTVATFERWLGSSTD